MGKRQIARAPRLPGTVRADAWRNILTGIGTSRDRSTITTFCADPVSDLEAEELCRGDWLSRKITETEVDDSFNPGFSVKVGDKILSEEIHAVLEELGFADAFIEAAKHENRYGGAAVWPVLNDGANPATPLKIDSGKIPRVESFLVFEPRELRASRYYSTLAAGKKFGKPATYTLYPQSSSGRVNATSANQEIHESRLILFPGIRVSRRMVTLQAGWGDSKLTRPRKYIADMGMVWSHLVRLLDDFAQLIIQLKDLATLQAEDEDGLIAARFVRLTQLKSTLGALVLDLEDKATRMPTPLAGVDELVGRFMTWTAAIADMPATRLWGVSPQGMNATGQSDADNWDKHVESRRTHHYGPRLEHGLRFILNSNDGPTRGKEPDVWSIEWNPLRQQSEKEKQESQKLRMETDVGYVNAGIVPKARVAEARFGGDTFSYDLQLTPEDIADIERAAEGPTPEELAAQAQMAQLTNGHSQVPPFGEHPPEGEQPPKPVAEA